MFGNALDRGGLTVASGSLAGAGPGGRAGESVPADAGCLAVLSQKLWVLGMNHLGVSSCMWTRHMAKRFPS